MGLVAHNVPLAVVLLEVYDDLALAGGLDLVVVAADPSPGEVVGADGFVLGDVAGDVSDSRDNAGRAVGLVFGWF